MAEETLSSNGFDTTAVQPAAFGRQEQITLSLSSAPPPGRHAGKVN